MGAQITLSGSGGVPPYSYFVSSGGGTINTTNNTYTAPQTTGQVTLGIKDSSGYYGYLNINVVSGSSGGTTLTISPAPSPIPTVTPGGQIMFSVSGGTAPYTYTVGGGANNGSFSGSTFTASPTQGQVQLTIADSAGNSQIISVDIVGSYNTTTLNQSFQALVDPYLAFSFDGQGAAPYFGFIDEGPSADANGVASGDANCVTSNGVASPCFVPIALTNFNPNVGAGVSYRGTITAVGPTATTSISYCIPPVHRTYAFIKATQGTYFGGPVTFNAAGKSLFNQTATTTAFWSLDSNSSTQGPGTANITITGAYSDTQVDCSDYDGTQYVNVGM
jgi:hypothetical protein